MGALYGRELASCDIIMTDSFPVFENGKNYILTGATLNSIVRGIKVPKVVTGGGLKIVEEREHEVFLALDPAGLNAVLSSVFGTLNLSVCVNNVSTSHTFVITR